MKKFIISILIIFGLIYVLRDRIVIPTNSIRFRVIASSDDENDQKIKMNVKKNIEDKLNNLLKNSKSVEETREIINNNISLINDKVANTLGNKDFTIDYGMNYFPDKEYKGILYKKGMYESLVITLGQGIGENWWCVLFPPLCMIEAEENEEIEYKILVKEIIDKYF